MDRILHNEELERRDKEWRERAKQELILKYESKKRAWKAKHKRNRTGHISKHQCMKLAGMEV